MAREAARAELVEADAPGLFAEIRAVARAAHRPPPLHVYLIDEVNAFIGRHGTGRVLGLGLPLLDLVTVAQLRAVIAHELGHIHDGDDVVFERSPEYVADAFAARLVGSTSIASGLRKIHAGSVAYEYYRRTEVQPVFDHGFRPPVIEGFRVFRRARDLMRILSHNLDDASAETAGTRSHPPSRARISAALSISAPERMPSRRSAIELIPDLEAVESALFTGSHARVLVGWAELPEKVYLPRWNARIAVGREALRDLAVVDVVPDAFHMRTRWVRVRDDAIARMSDDDEIVTWYGKLIGAAIISALFDRGWTPKSSPGASIRMLRKGRSIEVEPFVHRYLGGEVTREQWLAKMHELGIGDLVLG